MHEILLKQITGNPASQRSNFSKIRVLNAIQSPHQDENKTFNNQLNLFIVLKTYLSHFLNLRLLTSTWQWQVAVLGS